MSQLVKLNKWTKLSWNICSRGNTLLNVTSVLVLVAVVLILCRILNFKGLPLTVHDPFIINILGFDSFRSESLLFRSVLVYFKESVSTGLS